jgi:hypothetical protein
MVESWAWVPHSNDEKGDVGPEACTNPPALLLLRTHDDVKRTAAVLRMEESGPATPVSPLCARTHRGPSHDQFTEHDPGVCRRVWVDRKSAILPYGWSVYTTLLLTSRFTTNRMWREPWREPNASPPPGISREGNKQYTAARSRTPAARATCMYRATVVAARERYVTATMGSDPSRSTCERRRLWDRAYRGPGRSDQAPPCQPGPVPRLWTSGLLRKKIV